MFKTFIKGIVFGSGFSLAIMFFGYLSYSFFEEQPVTERRYTPADLKVWNEMDDVQQIKSASAIAVIQYKDSKNGLKEAYIESIYTKKGVIIQYSVGDRYPRGDHQSQAGYGTPSGAVAFFIGSPADNVSLSYLYNGKARGLGNMPLKAVIEIFKENA